LYRCSEGGKEKKGKDKDRDKERGESDKVGLGKSTS
jgi:hypothetical protein